MDKYCNYCGSETNYLRDSKFCEDCYISRGKYLDRDAYCISCGSVLPKYSQKFRDGKIHYTSSNMRYCFDCFPRNKVDIKKTIASHDANYYKNKVRIVYECDCKTEKKIKHHFDYDLPFDVCLLCFACHGNEHKRLNSLKQI